MSEIRTAQGWFYELALKIDARRKNTKEFLAEDVQERMNLVQSIVEQMMLSIDRDAPLTHAEQMHVIAELQVMAFRASEGREIHELWQDLVVRVNKYKVFEPHKSTN